MTDALELLRRVPSVLVFLTAVTVVSECCSVTGVFDGLAEQLVRRARGRIRLVWWLLAASTCLVTAFLSLDTAAVLMTSASVAVARRVGRPVAAFAFPTLWIANMASMWLPVSNLTTLLARDVLPTRSTLGYVQASWPVALTTTLAPLLIAAIMFRHDVRGRVACDAAAAISTPRRTPDRHARRLVASIVVLMSAALVVIEPALAAGVAALCCWAVVAWTRRGRGGGERPDASAPGRDGDATVRLPWSSLIITASLFLGVAILHGSGVLDGITHSLGNSPVWQLALAGAAGANVVNNLPAYLAFEPAAAHDTTRLLALLIGVNVASGMTWWGSVATLLWRDRLRREGEAPTLREHLLRTGLATAVTTAAALLVLEVC